MARVRVTLAESAVQDLEEIFAWYESQGVPEVGRRVIAKIIERSEGLADNPDIGRIVPEFGQKHIRELVEAPYRIVYKREKSYARVIRVWRSERLLRLSEERSD